MNNIDTTIQHITPAGGNLFAELGFAPEEAQRYHAESQKQINTTLMLKEQLIAELGSWIESKQLKQAEAAAILHISRPRVSDVVNKKTNKFTIDTLISLLGRADKPVTIHIG
ncbi:helix-turn-helix domain-containing protein [Iodobacter sp. BJB302]|uniref:helix-turn-helix domain-containing protein n=1 Tax=Iodobacter sp. BJB302 TaxID=1506510 RepID=UPI000C112582|nr:XRE family transcriptional regulator [Iodobacter sp. BJB302]PHV01645.1 XRE family transcriptional regulator [Iodobacter sp. BJB302]